MKRRNGFTLVELLVVIGIIALLISILMPALGKVKKQAQLVQCMATCRSMAQACQIHATDHRGYYPVLGQEHNLIGGVCNPVGLDDANRRKYTYYTDGGISRPAPMTVALGLAWNLKIPIGDVNSLKNYMDRPGFQQMFRCSSQDVPPTGATQRGDDGWSGPDEHMSYIFNEAFLGRRELAKDQAVGGSGTPKGNTSRVRSAASVFLFGDGLPRADGSNWMTVPETNLDQLHATMLDYYNMYQSSWKNFDLKRHDGRMVIVFVDGHAASVNIPRDLKDVGLTRGIYDPF